MGTVFTSESLKKLGHAEWVHPGTGEARVYINNLSALYGLRTSHYNTGNISSATLNGEKISNREAERILRHMSSAKLWLGGDGRLMHKGLSEQECVIILAALREQIKTARAEEAAAGQQPAQDTAPLTPPAAFTAETIRQWEVDAQRFATAYELAGHIEPAFRAQYAGVKLTTHGGLLRSPEALAVDAEIDRVCLSAGYPGEGMNSYELAVQIMARYH